MTLVPTEAYSPLIIDPNAVLTESFSREFLQAIARWNSKILKHIGRVENQQFAECCSLNCWCESGNWQSMEYFLRLLISETLDHSLIITHLVNNVKR